MGRKEQWVHSTHTWVRSHDHASQWAHQRAALLLQKRPLVGRCASNRSQSRQQHPTCHVEQHPLCLLRTVPPARTRISLKDFAAGGDVRPVELVLQVLGLRAKHCTRAHAARGVQDEPAREAAIQERCRMSTSGGATACWACKAESHSAAHSAAQRAIRRHAGAMCGWFGVHRKTGPRTQSAGRATVGQLPCGRTSHNVFSLAPCNGSVSKRLWR